MSSAAPLTSFTPVRIRETVQQILAAESLPAIVQAGHPALRQQSAPFDGQVSDEELRLLIDVMRQVMQEAPGVGLAAPQLGIPLQLAVLEDQFDLDAELAAARGRTPLEFFAILNPNYQPVGTQTAAFYEGCLSLTGLQAVVVRPQRIRLNFQTSGGTPSQLEFSGWQARIVQHETDHLNGELYVDRAEIRSLSNNVEYGTRWAGPDISNAREELGFVAKRPVLLER